MLSILSSFLLACKPKSIQGEIHHTITELLKMLLEILNSSREIYICLYVILPLGGLT